MSRTTEHEEAVNADSFLDIVASVVSVMIIMVMMTGLKIKNTPPEAALTGDVARAAGDLAQKETDERSLHGEIKALENEMNEVKAQTARRERERDMLSLAVTGLDQQLRGARQPAAQDPAADFSAKVADARNRLEILNRQREAIEKSPTASVQIETYNTPLGHTVVGRESHFQVKNGRIAYVPMKELVHLAQDELDRRRAPLSESHELTGTVGPIEGFRMTYMIRMRRPSTSEVEEAHSQRPIIDQNFVLRPVGDDIGETIDEALQPNSQFHQFITGRQAKDATITLWTYPGSFDDFRRLKKELYRLDFPVAARPLPDGVPISGSSHGSKSTAE